MQHDPGMLRGAGGGCFRPSFHRPPRLHFPFPLGPGSSASDAYARRAAEIERWLAARRAEGPWTSTDWELAGAQRILLRAAEAEREGEELVNAARFQGVGPGDAGAAVGAPAEDPPRRRVRWGSLAALVAAGAVLVIVLAMAGRRTEDAGRAGAIRAGLPRAHGRPAVRRGLRR